ncbi:hypothetical protein BDP55DRAFT_714282 [Colletotrichum godetiae]|uniref:Secreted protein n=1 Tax=Colletotrichum godetiae TaxID=1209918 RepID=A0AAJ0EZH1_9PEZI|nr:uncharacterized protein BDP55DRAFT_714282 [Colletotrichum godetiae]KAK1687447.1 hypothetical protein BDP55DRAFT_714282 [Colletotrichum godetiae]
MQCSLGLTCLLSVCLSVSLPARPSLFHTQRGFTVQRHTHTKVSPGRLEPLRNSFTESGCAAGAIPCAGLRGRPPHDLSTPTLGFPHLAATVVRIISSLLTQNVESGWDVELVKRTAPFGH